MFKIFTILLSLAVLIGAIYNLFNPFTLPQPEVYNKAQTLFASFMGFLVGGAGLVIGLGMDN